MAEDILSTRPSPGGIFNQAWTRVPYEDAGIHGICRKDDVIADLEAARGSPGGTSRQPGR
jgi:hypothetical protein